MFDPSQCNLGLNRHLSITDKKSKGSGIFEGEPYFSDEFSDGSDCEIKAPPLGIKKQGSLIF